MSHRSISKLTSKYQATIPGPVRNALQLEAGDGVVFEIDSGEVRLRKARPLDWDFFKALSGTFSEWHGKADEDAYRDL